MDIKTKAEFEKDHLDLIAKHGLRETIAIIHHAHSAWVLADLPGLEQCNPNMGATLRNRLETDVEFLERHLDILESILFASEMADVMWG
jgi:hypothetical protein